jgi:hypothetical protein
LHKAGRTAASAGFSIIFGFAKSKISLKPFKISTMKWTLLLAFTLAMAAGCEKSKAPDEDVRLKATADVNAKNNLIGTWRLFEYFEDRGDGNGHWVGATDIDEVTFTASGELKYSVNSPLARRGFDRYKVIDGNHVELYSNSSENREVYYYNRESDVHLLFNPQCRENCGRRYKLAS